MDSSDGNGYLIPENAEPIDMECILVFYPNDPMYLRALVGSLSYLGTWTAWERDQNKRGKLAARVWKDANDCTFDAMTCISDLVTALGSINTTLAAIQLAIENQESLDSVDVVTAVNGVQTAIESQQIELDPGLLLPALTGIQTAIENQADGSDDMGTVNVYCGCGCGSSTGTGTDNGDGDTVPGGIPIDDTPMPSDQDFTDPEWRSAYSQDDVCALVHYMLLSWRNLMLGIASGELATSAVYGVVNGMFSGLFGWQIPINATVNEFLVMFGKLTGSSSLASEIDANYETLQCQALQISDFRSRFLAMSTTIDSMSVPVLTKWYMKRSISIMPFAYIYTPTAALVAIQNLPSWAYTRGCPGCIGDDGELPISPPSLDYEWVPVNTEDPAEMTFVKENDVNLLFTGERVTVTAAAAGNGRKWFPTLTDRNNPLNVGYLIVCNYPHENDWLVPPVSGGETFKIPQNPLHYVYYNRSVDVDFGVASHTKKIYNSAASNFGQLTYYNSGVSGSVFTMDWYYLRIKE